MVVYIDTQDIDQYPGTVKRVAIDQEQIVPIGYEGDEQFVITVGTTAYSDNTARTAIQDQYITKFIAGWAKSSGFAGSGGGFALDSTHNRIRIKLDATVSGSDGSGYYEIILDHSNGAAIPGATVASDMETKIRAIPSTSGTWNVADTGYSLAYSNASVEYLNGKFWIISGSFSKYYTGSYRSSVAVTSGSTNDCSALLGFDIPMTSQERGGLSVQQATLASNYTGGSATLVLNAGTTISGGDVCMITDSTGNKEYFAVVSGTGNTLTIPTDITGIVNSYTTGNNAYVQKLQQQDPDMTPESWFSDIDQLIRFGIKNIVNQIDYSS